MFLYTTWFTTVLIFFQTTKSPPETEASVLNWQRRVALLPRATCNSLAGVSTVRVWAVTRTRKRIHTLVSKINGIWFSCFVYLAFLHATVTHNLPSDTHDIAHWAGGNICWGWLTIGSCLTGWLRAKLCFFFFFSHFPLLYLRSYKDVIFYEPTFSMTDMVWQVLNVQRETDKPIIQVHQHS